MYYPWSQKLALLITLVEASKASEVQALYLRYHFDQPPFWPTQGSGFSITNPVGTLELEQ